MNWAVPRFHRHLIAIHSISGNTSSEMTQRYAHRAKRAAAHLTGTDG